MITTLSGPNSFLLTQDLNKLISDFVSENSDFGLEKIDGEEADFERIREAIQSLPFLANKKMVVLRTPSANKHFVEQLETLLERVPDTTDLIIVEPKLDKRLAYYKSLKSKTKFQEFNELDSRGLANWLVERAKNSGGNIAHSDALYLVERVGLHQIMLANELDKLLSYDKNISRESIDLLTEPSPQSTIFDLIDSAFAGNLKRTLKLYSDQRELKVEPQQIIAMLAWQLNVLAIVKAGTGRLPDNIAKEAGLSPFVVRKTMNIANKVTLGDIKRLVSDALELDVRTKTESIDVDEAVKHYLLMITKSY